MARQLLAENSCRGRAMSASVAQSGVPVKCNLTVRQI